MIKPLVSICCITYNHVAFIRQCLDGFIMQKTNFPIEVLIHDDASTDGTADIIREYELKYPEIIKPIYQTENQFSKGVPISKTYNLPRVKGKYLAMCEGDDYWIDEYKLQKQVDFLEANDDFSICFHSVKVYHQEEGIIDENDGGRIVPDVTNVKVLASGNYIHTPSVMYRVNRDAIESIQKLKSKMIGDYICNMLFAGSGKIKKFAEKMSVYRVHKDSVWSLKPESYKSLVLLETINILISHFSNDQDIYAILAGQQESLFSAFHYHLSAERDKHNQLTEMYNQQTEAHNRLTKAYNQQAAELNSSYLQLDESRMQLEMICKSRSYRLMLKMKYIAKKTGFLTLLRGVLLVAKKTGALTLMRQLLTSGRNYIERKKTKTAVVQFCENKTKSGATQLWENEIRIPFDSPPLVSIIVPNYNHAEYLIERLDTIFAQTYSNYEVILLDDCSTDESRSILMEYACRYNNRTSIVFNDKNSGSVFSQWEKGLLLAKGSLIWIAESDDYASPDFLEKLVPAFESHSTMLAFCPSKFMQNGNCNYDTQRHLGDISDINWNSSFTMTAHQIVRSIFGIKNIIVNVSSAVFRNTRTALIAIKPAKEMKLCGDWLFFLHLIQGGAIYYTNEVTNFYRIHGTSTSLLVQKSEQYYREHETVSKFLIEHYDIPISTFQIVRNDLYEHYKSMNPKSTHWKNIDQLYNIDSIRKHAAMRKPNIFMGVFSMEMGGGEVFPLQLANELKSLGGGVTVLNFRIGKYDQNVRNFLDPSVPLIEIKSRKNLHKIIYQFGAEIFHSHHASVDCEVSELLTNYSLGCRQVITLHGMYEAIQPKEAARSLRQVIKTCGFFIYTADKNMTELRKLPSFNKLNLMYIGNALPKYKITPIERNYLGIGKDDFVFCLVSRGIPEKGWQEAADALVLANRAQGKKIHLVIIGEGTVRDDLVRQTIPNLHLLRNKNNIRDYFAMSDMGFLPSRFKGESYPLVVIDCLLSGKPILASDVGAVSQMLKDDNGNMAGRIFSLSNWTINVPELASIMRHLADDANDYRNLCEYVPLVAQKYDMTKTALKYLDVYTEVNAKSKHLHYNAERSS